MVAIVSATNGADTELLPPLTTRSTSLLETASALFADRLSACEIAADDRTRDAVIDIARAHRVEQCDAADGLTPSERQPASHQ